MVTGNKDPLQEFITVLYIKININKINMAHTVLLCPIVLCLISAFLGWCAMLCSVMAVLCKRLLSLSCSGKESSSFTVRLHACLPPGFFKPNRFHPQRNNIRTKWYTGLDSSDPGHCLHMVKLESPNAHYYNCFID